MSLNHILLNSGISNLNLQCNSIAAGTGSYSNMNISTLNCGTGIAATRLISPVYDVVGSNGFISVNTNPIIQYTASQFFPYNDNTIDLGLPIPNAWKTVNAYNYTAAGTGTVFNGSAGRVLQKEFYISAYHNIVQSVTNNTQTNLAFNTDDKNVNWTTSRSDNTRFIGPIAGYYQVSYNCSLVASQAVTAAVQFQSIIIRNGNASGFESGSLGQSVQTAGNTTTGAIGLCSNGSCTVYMNGSTDYIQISVLQNHSGALNYGFAGVKSGGSNIVQVRYLGQFQ